MNWKALGSITALAVLVIAFGVFELAPRIEAQQGSGPAVAGKYTVVDTEGTNLVVVDNAKNTLYFYTVDPGKEVGDDLHLRGTIDLNHVGKAVLKSKKMSK
jgi:hypothetical protein